MVILITGKANSGKTHYATELQREMVGDGFIVEHIDGDDFRKIKGNNDYSDEGRMRNLKDAAERAAELENEGYIVLCSFIAPKKKWRNMMRKYWEVSRVVYMPGGTLWKGTTYQRPSERELRTRYNYRKHDSIF